MNLTQIIGGFILGSAIVFTFVYMILALAWIVDYEEALTMARHIHKCAAKGCPRFVPMAKLMCHPCWDLVSIQTQADVYVAYAESGGWEGNVAHDMRYAQIARRAIREVAQAKAETARDFSGENA